MAYGPQRREAKRFEPPPWEREQFERLEQERARDIAPVATEPDAPAVPEPQAAPGVGEQIEAAAQEPEPAEVPGVDAMLQALKAEEPQAVESAWKYALIASVLVGTIGFMLLIWGMVALARSAGGGPTGILGATIMSVMGALFIGLAVWMGVRSLKQRGVL